MILPLLCCLCYVGLFKILNLFSLDLGLGLGLGNGYGGSGDGDGD